MLKKSGGSGNRVETQYCFEFKKKAIGWGSSGSGMGQKTTKNEAFSSGFYLQGEEQEEWEEVQEVCSYFGCRKKLTLQETLCGSRCIDHQEKETDITNILNF